MPSYVNTAKWALRKLTGSNVISDIDQGFADLADDIDGKMAGYAEGTSAPTGTTKGRIFRRTSTKQTYIDFGAAAGVTELATMSSGAARVDTSQAASGSPGDLATVGPSVTIIVPDLGGGEGLVELYASVIADVTGGVGNVYLAIDGSLAGGYWLFRCDHSGRYGTMPGPASAQSTDLVSASTLQGLPSFVTIPLAAGSHTLKLQYNKDFGTVEFASRVLVARAIR